MTMIRKLSMLTVLLALPAVAGAANIHFVGTPTCSAAGDQLCCSGKLAGVGTAPTVVEVLTTAGCINRGGNEPRGQVSGDSGPIQPRGGNITFTNVCTDPVDCPDQMGVTFGPGATLNVFQRGNLVFSATIQTN